MMQSGYNINDLVQEAQTRWLKPAEVLFILQNYNEDQLTREPPHKPSSGSLFLFNKRVLRFFRRDGHSWRRKKDGRSVGEAHEHLKVGNVEALNCYYAHGEQNPNFQRRSYWMLDRVYEHLVLVHYRDITELQGRNSSGSFSKLLRVSPSALSQSPSSYTAQHLGSTAVINELSETCQNLSSPGSVEGSSDVGIKSNMMNRLDCIERTCEISSSSELDIQALRMLEEQLSLTDDRLEEFIPFVGDNENSNCSQNIVDRQSYGGSAEMQAESNNLALQWDTGDNGKLYHQSLGHEFAVDSEDSFSWKEMLEFYKSLPDVESQEKNIYTSDGNGMLPATSNMGPVEEHEDCHGLNFGRSNAISSLALLPIEIENLKFPVYTPAMDDHDTNPDYYTTLFEDHPGMPLGANSSLTIAQKQKFTIREISPEWGYASEATKVLIIGSFLCGSSECEWSCMIGDIEVPLLIIQEGVICCQAPPHLPGKVTLCVTSGNRESCSEVREFEYRDKPTSSAHCSSSLTEETKTREELSLLVRFVHILLSETLIQKVDNSGSGIDWLSKCKAGEDSWSRVHDALLADTWTSCGTTDWLLQELLKDKLQQWLSSRSGEGNEQLGCSWSKNEQGIIHIVAGLGFEWALSAILHSGVGVNFRDINGWTALHWAAHFGREKMVAALIASGASAGALTDPTSQDPTGQTAASIAASSGYKGLAGYLSEVALISHLSSLTLEESELSKNSAEVEAETTVNNISMRSLDKSEDDQLSLKDTLAAVRNAAQAAARIQSAFRAHSFRKRKQKKAAAAAAAATGADEYDVLSNDVQGLSAASKLVFRNVRDYNSAAITIQKKYRGWKGRKDFIAFRQNVVKIQAHVRGHQVRIYYKVICWAVSVLEKVVIRWRRGGVGLRGYKPESEPIDESDDEDIFKLFRKQKVHIAVEEAVSRVLSMVESPDARQQYRRMLERYRLAKAERGVAEGHPSTSQTDVSNNTYHFP